MRIYPFLASIAIIGAAAGCSSEQSTTATPTGDTSPGSTMVPLQSKSEVEAPSGATEGGATGTGSTGKVNVPPGMTVGSGTTLAPTPELDARIASLEKKGNAKKELAAAYAARGYSHMTNGANSPRVMYRVALKDFRRALKLDPTNKVAKENKDQIEAIYKQMGRPIPTD